MEQKSSGIDPDDRLIFAPGDYLAAGHPQPAGMRDFRHLSTAIARMQTPPTRSPN
jgi:hypothetical protein